MRKTSKFILSVLGASLMFSACTRKAIPGLSAVKAAKEYNQAAFNSFFVEGTKQKLMGNLGESLRYFEQCLSMNPESDATYYQMAQIMINNGDIGSGKKYINKAVVLQPENLWYQMTLAGVYYQQKNLDSAIICYEKAVKEYPEREGLQISLANLYTENQKYEKARGILNRFDEKYGVNDNTTVSLIRALMAEKKYGEARVKVDQLLVQNPDDVVFNGLLAEIYSGEGENGKAFDVYNRLFERNPGDPHIQLSLCDFLLTEKNYGELLNLMNTVLLNDRITRQEKVSLVASLIENKDIIKNYGPKMELVIMVLEAKYAEDDLVSLLRPDFLQKEGNLTGAATRLEEIIRSRPDNYYAWEKLLLVYYELKDYVTLENRGKECATRFNRSVLAKILYANGALENKNFEVALEELRKADILAGENKDIKLQVLTMKADVYYRMKNFPDAFKTFDEALKLNDNDNTVMNNYAYYLAEQDMKLKEAEEMAVKVIEKEPSNTTFLDTYAWVLYKRGKTREAAKIMEKILGSGETDDAEWYEHYGFILKKMGKCREAVEKWETALSLDKSKTNLQKEIENCKK
jgi:predicted Zn-dependent protease